MGIHTHNSPSSNVPSGAHVHSHDPATGTPDFHPVGTGVGAAAGGVMAGAAVGAVTGGPIGAAVGGAVGAFAGGLAGKAIAHRIDSDLEDNYWRENHAAQPYARPGTTYDDYGPAYRYGVSTYPSYRGRDFDEVDSELAHDWGRYKGKSNLEWEHARHAARASWYRLNRQFPEDAADRS